MNDTEKKEKYFHCSNHEFMTSMNKIFSNLRSLEWTRVNVLLCHDLLVNWSLKNHLCFAWAYDDP